MELFKFAAAGLIAAVLFANTGAQAHESQGRKSASMGSATSALGGDGERVLADIRRATERYRDIEVALAEGYITDPAKTCETAEKISYPKELGAMGVHYFRPDLLGITATSPRIDGAGLHVDYMRPSILIYEPQADGSMELVAIENLVFEKAWLAANAEGPRFLGVPFDRMADDPATEADEGHHFEPHFDLHVWLYRDNPNGMFAQFNPAVTCDFATTQQAAK